MKTDTKDTQATEQLIEAVQRLSLASSLQDVIDIVKSAARTITQADGASFVLRDEDRCYYVDEDAVEPLWKGRRFPMEICVSGWAMRNCQAVVIPDIYADPRVPHAAYRPTFVKSLVLTPIRTLQPIGAIGIYWRDTHAPTPAAVKWLQSLADTTALALEHIQARAEASETAYSAALLKKENAALRRDLEQAEHGDFVKMCFVTNRLELNGVWLSVEAFLARRFGLQVTHGLSPEGVRRLEGDPPPSNENPRADASGQ